MKAYIDDNGDIKELHESTNPELKEVIIDEELVFKDFTDEEILQFRYIPMPLGYQVVPQPKGGETV